MLQIKNQFILISIPGRCYKLPLKDLKFLIYQKGITVLHLEQESPIKVIIPLKRFGQVLADHGFSMVKRGLLVNVQYISQIDYPEKIVILSCGNKLTASRRGLKLLKEVMRNTYD